MEIDGKPLEEVLQGVRELAGSLERGLQIDHTDSEYLKIQEKLDACNARRRDLELLQLAEEKRKFLTCIIEWMNVILGQLGPYELIGTVRQKMSFLAELHKRVNSSKTLDALALIDKELAAFEQGAS